MVDVDLLYRQHLTEADRRLLATVVGPEAPLPAAFGSPALEEAVFAAGDDAMTVGASPFLAFATAVHRTAAALQTATFVEERWTPRVRIPVFDTADLRRLLADPARSYFLVELLASYTRVSSGATWTRTARGWRRRRFSELDPARLAEQLELVSPGERAGVYRRLGDLSLFLLGVFPDHPPLPVGAGADRVLRHSGLRSKETGELTGPALFERLGASWYRAATRLASGSGQPVTGTLAVAGEIADHFPDARRVLNAITDRYLFPLRSRWFPA